MNGDLKMNSMAMVLQKIDFDRATLYYPKMMNWDRERDFDEVMGESLPAVIQIFFQTDSEMKNSLMKPWAVQECSPKASKNSTNSMNAS